MATIKAMDQAVVITSSLTNEELKKAQKYFPDALTLKDKDEDGKSYVKFAIAHGYTEGSVSTYGIEFIQGASEEKAAITVTIPKLSKKAREEYVKDCFGKALQNLIAIEKDYAAKKEAFDKEYAEIGKNITVE